MDKQAMKGWGKETLFKGISVFVVMILSTFVSFILYQAGVRIENILMVYVFGILLVVIQTKSYFWSTFSSVTFVFTFNYLFTEPIYTFRVNDTNYIISLTIFLIVSLIVSRLALKLQKQIEISVIGKKITDNLYKISSGYLNISGMEQVVRYGLNSLKMVYESEYVIYVKDQNNKGKELKMYGQETEDTSGLWKGAKWCFEHMIPCGKGTPYFEELGWVFLPVISNQKTLGVLGIQSKDTDIDEAHMRLIQSVLSQIAVAMDREYSNMAEHEIRLASEREKLKSSLLRSISHDLRTPLAGITGSASFLLESWKEIEEESMVSLLNDILNDSVWLSNLVDNLLNMTRIQEGRLVLRHEEEVVDDIISETVARVQRRIGTRKLLVDVPEDWLIVPMDGQLIVLVLVNLIDNAMKHTKAQGKIKIEVKVVTLKEENQGKYARFEVIDDGTGIEESILNTMFESFVTTDNNIADATRGMGLGLNICKAIINAHEGVIGGYNNEDGGATVYFLLPLVRKEESN